MLPRPLSASRRGAFLRLVAIGVGQALAAISIALLVKQAFDRLISAPTPVEPMTVAALVGGLVLAVACTALLRGRERVAGERLGQHYVFDVRETLFEHLTRVPARELGRRHRGSMLLRFVGDLSALRLWVSRGLARLLVAGVAIGLALVALAVMNPALSVAVGCVLAGGALATWAVSPRLLRTARTSRRHRSRLTGEVTERLTQVAVLQASGQERREGKRVGRRSGRGVEAMVDQARASGAMRAIAEGTAAAAGVTAVLVGAVEVRAGRATPGTVVAALSIAGLLSGYLRDLGRVAEYAAAAKVARGAAERFLSMAPLPDPPGLPALTAEGGALDIEAVGLGDALCGVTLRAEPGQTVAIVGPNGAGKSTLVALAARLVDPDHGRVCIDGQDVRSRSLASVRRAVGIAGPDLPLLRGSLSRNVRYRLPRCDDAEVARVSELCRLDELAASLPEAWRSDVGEGGSRLSAGQRARISVARAALGRPALLILDEAEAHLDRDSAAIVDRVLADHTGTALVVTHRRELVERADVVWCLEDGRVAEVGPPDQLLRGHGPTAELIGRTSAGAVGSRPEKRLARALAVPETAGTEDHAGGRSPIPGRH